MWRRVYTSIKGSSPLDSTVSSIPLLESLKDFIPQRNVQRRCSRWVEGLAFSLVNPKKSWNWREGRKRKRGHACAIFSQIRFRKSVSKCWELLKLSNIDTIRRALQSEDHCSNVPSCVHLLGLNKITTVPGR